MKSLRDYNIDFMGVRRPAITISIVLVLLSIGSLIFQGLNWGLDFTGGALVEVTLPSPVEPDEVRAALDADGFVDGVVQNFGTERDLLIRMPPQEGRDAA